MKINVVGLGYIGLPTALMLAKNNVEVVGTDLDEILVEKLSQGEITFEEPDLPKIFEKALQNGIEFSTKLIETNLYIIAVPTPYIQESKLIDMKYVVTAFKQIIDVCSDDSIIIVESTVSPGSIDKYIRPLMSRCEKKINVCHAPERIIPGNMIHELTHNSRTVGVDNEIVGKKVTELYSKFCESEINITDIKSAEMSKVVENTFRDINIAFANELAKICRNGDLDVYEIISLANKHPRVSILSPGPGVGGHCISVDPWFLVGDYPELAVLTRNAREINDSMPIHVLDRLREILKDNDNNQSLKVGLYGLSYKENVDDIRESPSLQLLKNAKKENVKIDYVFDPFVSLDNGPSMSFNEFISESDIIVINVAHDHIKNNIHQLSDKIVLDCKNICPFESYKL